MGEPKRVPQDHVSVLDLKEESVSPLTTDFKGQRKLTLSCRAIQVLIPFALPLLWLV